MVAPRPTHVEPGRGLCRTCKFWTDPVEKKPNFGVCELTTLVNLRRSRFPRALAKVAIIEGDVETHRTLGDPPTEISLITVGQFGCPSWERE